MRFCRHCRSPIPSAADCLPRPSRHHAPQHQVASATQRRTHPTAPLRYAAYSQHSPPASPLPPHSGGPPSPVSMRSRGALQREHRAQLSARFSCSLLGLLLALAACRRGLGLRSLLGSLQLQHLRSKPGAAGRPDGQHTAPRLPREVANNKAGWAARCCCCCEADNRLDEGCHCCGSLQQVSAYLSRRQCALLSCCCQWRMAGSWQAAEDGTSCHAGAATHGCCVVTRVLLGRSLTPCQR